MIIDCHSHIWPSRETLGQAVDFSCLSDGNTQTALAPQHREATDPADMVFVLGFVSNMMNAEISNDLLKTYLDENASRTIGFAGIDPTEKQSVQQIREYNDQGVFAGITLSPACQGFHPTDSRAMAVYEIAESLTMPIYFLQGEILPASANLLFAQPEALDEVARSFPALKMVVSHMGYPWTEQMIALLSKHQNIFADVAGICGRPWQAYRTLTLAYEYHVMDKLLFGSDFPSQTVKTAVESIYNLNKLTIDSVLPAIPREQLRGIVERDSLELLGLGSKP